MSSKKLLFLLLLFLLSSARALTFNEAILRLGPHDLVKNIEAESGNLYQKAAEAGSWGDPRFKISAKNFPKDSWQDDLSPMTGVEFAISQKIALTTKYRNLKNSFMSLGLAKKFESTDLQIKLVKKLWNIVIYQKKLLDQIKILNENLNWLGNTFSISKKLYATGRISQQTLLDIQIRKSELEGELSNKQFELEQTKDQLFYLIQEENIETSTIPWKLLSLKAEDKVDYKEKSLKQNVIAGELKLTAAKLSFIPDITISAGYTKRSNIDNNGDFVGVSISFPLPFSSTQYSKHGQAVQIRESALRTYLNYKRGKVRDISILKKDLEKIIFELEILENKTMVFAESSRAITSKSYALGNSTYTELLQAELKLQNILIKRSELIAMKRGKQVELKYLLGESLYE